jgi:hypothetical protein
MKERITLTSAWVASFVAALVITESYLYVTTAEGILLALPEDRLDHMGELAKLYGPYIAGILAFWFVKPFGASKSDAARRVRFWLALSTTAILNAWVLYLLTEKLRIANASGTVLEDIRQAVKHAAVLSFLVAPVNAYYFGMKSKS